MADDSKPRFNVLVCTPFLSYRIAYVFLEVLSYTDKLFTGGRMDRYSAYRKTTLNKSCKVLRFPLKKMHAVLIVYQKRQPDQTQTLIAVLGSTVTPLPTEWNVCTINQGIQIYESSAADFL